jgi:hypothetical protein
MLGYLDGDSSPSRLTHGELDQPAVPSADPDAVIDPHWLELRGDGLLPSLYMPAPMAGRHSPLMRAVAASLIGLFLLATTLGVCLTYGPPNFSI